MNRNTLKHELKKALKQAQTTGNFDDWVDVGFLEYAIGRHKNAPRR